MDLGHVNTHVHNIHVFRVRVFSKGKLNRESINSFHDTHIYMKVKYDDDQ